MTGFVFVVVEATLVWFLVRYRRGDRPREGEGPQVRGHTRIEVAWTLVPVVLLASIVAFVFMQLPEIEDAPAAGPADSIAITVGVTSTTGSTATPVARSPSTSSSFP